MKSLRTGTLGIALLALGVTGAIAGGLGGRGSIKDGPAAAPLSWTGFYLGLHAGGAWGDSDWKFADNLQSISNVPAGTAFSLSPEGVLVGLQAGLQQQWGNWVAGIEVSFSGSPLRDSNFIPFPAQNDDTFKIKINDLLLVTGRLGYASDRWLVYAKGGFAGADVTATVVDTVTGGGQIGIAPNSWRSSEWVNGWTVGGGFEYRLLSNVSLGIDYSFVDLGSQSHSATVLNSANAPTHVPGTAKFDIDNQVHIVTGRLNFALGN